MTYSNKEKRKEYDKKYRELNREKRNEQNKEWYKKNKEQKSEYNKKWHQLNKEKISEKRKEYSRKYYELNKKEISKYNEKNKENRLEYAKAHRKERKAYCIEYLGGKCVKCGSTERLEFDHIKREGKKYEISTRVTNNLNNLKEELDKCQLLCVDCHKIKTKSERTILTETCKMKHIQGGDGQSVAIV